MRMVSSMFARTGLFEGFVNLDSVSSFMKTDIRIIYNPRRDIYEFRSEQKAGCHIVPMSGWNDGVKDLERTKAIALDIFGKDCLISVE